MLPQIDIQSTMGRIGIKYTPLQSQIHSQPADLSIETPAAQLSISYTPGDLQIDQTQAFNQEGLMSPLTLAKDRAQNAKQTAERGVEQTVSWGNQFADLAHKGGDLGQYAMRYRTAMKSFALTLVPSPFSVHISYQMGKATINAQPSPVRISAHIHQPEVSVQPGTAQTYVEQPSSLTITPPPLGQLVDSKI